MPPPPNKGRLVYSTGPTGSSASPAPATAGPVPVPRAPREHQLRVRRETAGRGGKTVTTAGPLFLARADALALVGELKRSFGTGGTLTERPAPDGAPAFAVELQGDHADRLVAELARRGYPVKRAGG